MKLTTAAQVRSRLQQAVRDAIAERQITLEDLARRMDLLPVGAEVLLAQKDWTMEVAFTIAAAIGLAIEVEVRTP